MAKLPYYVELTLIVLGLSAGTIAISIIMAWLSQKIHKIRKRRKEKAAKKKAKEATQDKKVVVVSPADSEDTQETKSSHKSQAATNPTTQQRESFFGLFPVMFKSSRQHSLMDVVHKEERASERMDEEESVDDDSVAVSIRSAAELAAAWKLKAWTKEHDSLVLSSSSEEPAAANSTGILGATSLMCVSTSCANLSEPPTTGIVEV